MKSLIFKKFNHVHKKKCYQGKMKKKRRKTSWAEPSDFFFKLLTMKTVAFFPRQKVRTLDVPFLISIEQGLKSQ